VSSISNKKQHGYLPISKVETSWQKERIKCVQLFMNLDDAQTLSKSQGDFLVCTLIDFQSVQAASKSGHNSWLSSMHISAFFFQVLPPMQHMVLIEMMNLPCVSM